jgi:hypothetical protein
MSSGLANRLSGRVILNNAAHIRAQSTIGRGIIVRSVIASKYAALGGETGWLGKPVGEQKSIPGGLFQDYQHGSIYWSRASGAFEVHGAIRDKWRAMGAERSFLGFPLSDETPAAGGGRYSRFQGGEIYWSAATGAFEVHGAILAHWRRIGGERVLGYPVSDELRAPGDVYRFSNFQHGQIAWSPSTGAHLSATSVAQPSGANGGGIRLLNIDGQPTGSWEKVRRKVIVTAAMAIQDEENFGSNEHASANGSNEAVLTQDVSAGVLEVIKRMGGEIRVELRAFAMALANGDVKVRCRAELFEGTSENTDDLDGVEEHTFLVPRDGSVSPNFRVRNTDEGDDDFADISLHFINRAA